MTPRTRWSSCRRARPAQRLIAILGSDQAALNTGVDRLLDSDFANCVRRPYLALCPNPAASTDMPMDTTTATPTPTPTATTTSTTTPGAVSGTLVPTFTPTSPGALHIHTRPRLARTHGHPER
ncbi:MAG: hypothetical protein R3A10_10105 [Caldilineaceae bacterium]